MSQDQRDRTVDYEGSWDHYARHWSEIRPGLEHIGDEWTGRGAGAAASLGEYRALIEERLIRPYIGPRDVVLEIGVGGGRTAELLRRYCQRLICADVSAEMLAATRARLGDEGVDYIKLDGLTLDALPAAAADVCFCFDTMVHIEPRDIFNYLARLPPLLRGKRLGIFHHAEVLSERGWLKFLSEWRENLGGRRLGTAFSVMTEAIMERFLTHLGYEVLVKNDTWVPRDRVWICRCPETVEAPLTAEL